jgi:CheY-like chemotaxis protein
MPKMTGLEFASRLRASRPDLPVILCTGYAENLGHEEVERSGVRALLGKPVAPETLFAAVRSALGVASGARRSAQTGARSRSAGTRRARSRR